MSKLIVIDNGNIMHKAIFAVIAQINKEMKIIAKEKNWVDNEGKILDYKWGECFKIVMKKSENREIYIMKPPLTYLRMIIGYLKKIGITLDNKVVIADDFGSWRKDIDLSYKRQRKAFRESKMPEWWWDNIYEEFNEFFEKLDNCLPFNRIKIYKMESDDIASMAVRYLEADEKILVSSDEDWQQLCVLPNVKVFSPYTKKYKIIFHPEKILLKKIKGDISDNLLEAPKTEAEFEKRRMIVDLIHLPQHIENIILPVIQTLPIKNIYINKVPFRSCREELKKLYKLDE